MVRNFLPKKKDAISCSSLCASRARSVKTKQDKLNWKKENKEKVRQSQALYRKTHKEEIAEYNKNHRQRHREWYAEYQSLRTRNIQQAKPSWANDQDIKDVYLEAKYLQLEVDHIIPLKHPLVCGLHVWDNLQLLTRSENAKKSNKFDADVLCVIE